jgi:hypothetical protein
MLRWLHMESTSDHVSLRRLWDFSKGLLRLEMGEHTHILDCRICSARFRACIRAETFTEAQRNDRKPSAL